MLKGGTEYFSSPLQELEKTAPGVSGKKIGGG